MIFFFKIPGVNGILSWIYNDSGPVVLLIRSLKKWITVRYYIFIYLITNACNNFSCAPNIKPNANTLHKTISNLNCTPTQNSSFLLSLLGVKRHIPENALARGSRPRCARAQNNTSEWLNNEVKPAICGGIEMRIIKAKQRVAKVPPMRVHAQTRVSSSLQRGSKKGPIGRDRGRARARQYKLR